MKNHKRTAVKKHARKANSGVKHGLKAPLQKNFHKSNVKGWRRIESELVGLSKEIELVDDEAVNSPNENDQEEKELTDRGV